MMIKQWQAPSYQVRLFYLYIEALRARRKLDEPVGSGRVLLIEMSKQIKLSESRCITLGIFRYQKVAI